MYLVRRYTDVGNLKIGQLFGGIHYSAVSKAAAMLTAYEE